MDIRFSQSNDPNALNVIAISTSNQATTAGISYLPNIFSKLVWMSSFPEGVRPYFFSGQTTNYDYEVLVHEIGHALGLKHPFEASGENSSILSAYEDNTYNTAMSYDDRAASFNGTFRPLDWMTLAKFYGVKSTYKAGDDTYVFSNLSATFIIDGAESILLVPMIGQKM